MVGSSLKISAVNCNITIRDPNCWFDASQLLHKFEIHLDRPFERSVALFVLNLVASHQTYVISHSSWYDDVNKVTENLNLVQRVRENNRLDSDQRQTVDRLRSIQTVANDINLAVKLFNDVDVDRSGRLDEQEFEDLIGKLGIELKDITVKELMAEYDVDGGWFSLDRYRCYPFLS